MISIGEYGGLTVFIVNNRHWPEKVMPNTVQLESVTSAEITRNFGHWQDRASRSPLMITYHGRPKFVLLSADIWKDIGSRAVSKDVARGRDQHRFDLLTRHIEGGLLVLGADLVVTEASLQCAGILGLDTSEIVGKALADLPPPFDFAPAVPSLRSILRTGEEVHLEVPSNIDRDVHLRVKAFAWPEGVALIVNRISAAGDRAQSEAMALDKARNAHGMVAIVRLTMRGTVSSVDGALSSAIGLPVEKMRGVRLTDMLAVSDRSAARDAIEEMLVGGIRSGARAFDTRLLTSDGREAPARIAIAPLTQAYTIEGVLAIITLQSQAETPVGKSAVNGRTGVRY